jgi:glycosyltransferase involved in cell wall biosynthesis
MVSNMHSQEPLVGVGIPVYNGARYLHEVLDALLAQTCRGFEAIICDNASTDETPRICADYIARDRRLRYVRQERNFGLAANWNHAFHMARGRYFKWAAANDFFSANFLESCIARLEADAGAALAFADAQLIGPDGADEGRFTGAFELLENSPAERFAHVSRRLGLNIPISGVIRREALTGTGLIRAYPASDLVLMAELALRGRFVRTGEATFFRRIDAGSHSRHLSKQALIHLHNPEASGAEPVATWLHRDLLLATLRAPRLRLGDRLGAAREAIRRALSVRHEILHELLPRSGRRPAGAGPANPG